MYYSPNKENRFFKVTAEEVQDEQEELYSNNSKRVARHITLVEEVTLPWEDEEFQTKAVTMWSYYLMYVPNPTEEVKKMAITKYWIAIKYVKEPSEELQLIAIKQNGRAISFINNPTPKAQMMAVKDNWRYGKYIMNPTPEVIKYVDKKTKTQRENIPC